MRVRVLKNITVGGRVFRAGETAEIGPEMVDGLLSVGLVMQDKSLDGAKEMKARDGSN